MKMLKGNYPYADKLRIENGIAKTEDMLNAYVLGSIWVNWTEADIINDRLRYAPQFSFIPSENEPDYDYHYQGYTSQTESIERSLLSICPACLEFTDCPTIYGYCPSCSDDNDNDKGYLNPLDCEPL